MPGWTAAQYGRTGGNKTIHGSRARWPPASGDRALKVVPNEVQDFGSVHVRFCLSLRRSNELMTRRALWKADLHRKSDQGRAFSHDVEGTSFGERNSGLGFTT
jgi:hypothetical protein